MSNLVGKVDESRPLGFVVVFTIMAATAIMAVQSLCNSPETSQEDISPLMRDTEYATPLLVMRVCFFVLCLSTLWVILCDRTPFEFKYLGNKVSLTGLARWSTMTVWTFTLETVYFGGVSLVSLGYKPEGLLVFSFLLFEIVYPLAMLITVVVTFVLYPTAVKLKMDDQVQRMFHWPVLVMHVANLFMAQFEMLAIGYSLRDDHFVLPVLYGCLYVAFAWVWFLRTQIFYYFFLDWRRWYAPLAYIGLLIVLRVLYYVAAGISHFIARHWISPFIVLTATSFCCQFRHKA